MPYAGRDDSKLPKHVQEMPMGDRRHWVAAYKEAHASCMENEGDDCDGHAMRIANGSLKKTVTKDYMMEWAPQALGRRSPQATAQYNALGGTDTKACANCLFFISPNMCTVVEDWPVPISPTGLSNYWTAVPEMHPMPMPVVIVDADEMEKAVWDTAYINDLPDSAFAIVLSGGEKDDSGKTVPRSLRKLPHHNTDGSIDLPHLRNALAREPQADMTAGEHGRAKAHLDRHAKAEGIGEAGEKGLWAWLKEKASEFFTESTFGTTESHQGGGNAPQGDALPESSVRFYKQADGEWRWVAIVSNKFRDWDNPPEIITEEAHKEYVDYVDKAQDYPEMWLWHTPGTRWGIADLVDYVDGFLVWGGLVDKGKEAWAERLSAMEDLGMSHGFYPRYTPGEKGIIGHYRTFEGSALPREYAANPWTALGLLQEDIMAFDPNKRAYLSKVMGEDEVARLEGALSDGAKALIEAGIEYKAKEGAGDSPSFQDVPPDTETVAEAVAKAITESPGWKAMETEIGSLKESASQLPDIVKRLTALEASDDEKIAAVVGAKIPGFGGFRASQAKETALGDDSALKDAGPGWMTEAIGAGAAKA